MDNKTTKIALKNVWVIRSDQEVVVRFSNVDDGTPMFELELSWEVAEKILNGTLVSGDTCGYRELEGTDSLKAPQYLYLMEISLPDPKVVRHVCGPDEEHVVLPLELERFLQANDYEYSTKFSPLKVVDGRYHMLISCTTTAVVNDFACEEINKMIGRGVFELISESETRVKGKT